MSGKGVSPEKHAIHACDSGHIELSQGLIESEAVLEHLSHVGGTGRAPIGQWLVERGLALKNAHEAGDIVDTPIANHRSVQEFGRGAASCVIVDGRFEGLGSVGPGWEAVIRLRDSVP